MARSDSGDSLLTRVMRILRVFSELPAATVSEIAARTGLPLTTAHRLVGEMVEFGLLERDSERRVRMGVRLWEMSLRSHHVLGLREAARPYMEDLQSLVRQHIEISVRTGTEVLYVERLSSPDAVATVSRIARRLPVYACSPGLVMLAHAPAGVQDEVLAGPLEAFTPMSMTDPRALRRAIAGARQRGYAVAPGLIVPGSKGIAAPLRDATGEVVAALSMVIPMSQDHRRLVGALMTAARGVSRSMGARETAPSEFLRLRNPDAAD